MQKQIELAKWWVQVYQYHQTQIVKENALIYAQDVVDFTFDQLSAAWAKWRGNNRKPPMPYDLIKIADPKPDDDFVAREIAARIVGSVPKLGYPNGSEARDYIGEVGWGVVQRMGGWSYVCETMGVSTDPSTFQAQAREIIKGHLQHAPEAIQAAISAPERNLTLVADIDILKQIEATKSGGLE